MPKKRKPNPAAQALKQSTVPVYPPEILRYFVDRYEHNIQSGAMAEENEDRPGARIEYARAAECALFLAHAYSTSDGEQAEIWQQKTHDMQRKLRRRPRKDISG